MQAKSLLHAIVSFGPLTVEPLIGAAPSESLESIEMTSVKSVVLEAEDLIVTCLRGAHSKCTSIYDFIAHSNNNN